MDNPFKPASRTVPPGDPEVADSAEPWARLRCEYRQFSDLISPSPDKRAGGRWPSALTKLRVIMEFGLISPAFSTVHPVLTHSPGVRKYSARKDVLCRWCKMRIENVCRIVTKTICIHATSGYLPGLRCGINSGRSRMETCQCARRNGLAALQLLSILLHGPELQPGKRSLPYSDYDMGPYGTWLDTQHLQAANV